MTRPWLILDRDDTILDDPGYLCDPEQIKFLPFALEGLRRFAQAGWPLVVITNQSGIGRGYFGPTELTAVHSRFRELLSHHGLTLAGIYHCPHAPDEGCSCRKPEPLLAQKAERDLGLALSDSVTVGDKKSDLELGRRIHSRFVAQIVAPGRAKEEADGHFDNLLQLADALL